MRAFKLPFTVRNPVRLLGSISVRSRIIALALIPAIGFLINGVTYFVGEHDVGGAFQTVKSSGELADASREFKGAVAAMRIIVKDFSVHPSKTLVMNFQASAGAGAEQPRHHRGFDQRAPRRHHRRAAHRRGETERHVRAAGGRPDHARL